MHLHKPGINLFKHPLNPFHTQPIHFTRAGFTLPTVIHHLMHRQATQSLTLTIYRKQETGNKNVSRFPKGPIVTTTKQLWTGGPHAD
jgi:hypothetical protein